MKFQIKYKEGDFVNGALFVEEVSRENGLRVGIFKCPYCGANFKYRVSKMAETKNNSCGCTSYSNMRRNVIHGHNSNNKPSPEYCSWHSMIQRCTNPNNGFYKYYGGVGKKVCDRWKNSFSAFFEIWGLDHLLSTH